MSKKFLIRRGVRAEGRVYDGIHVAGEHVDVEAVL
jgi:hypothetical protein